MAKTRSTHRLWQPPARDTAPRGTTIIAKVRAGGAPGARNTASVAAARAGAADALDRLIENGYASGVRSVFADDGQHPGPLLLADVGGVATVRGARGRAVAPRSAGIVEITVAPGTSPKELATHIAALAHIEYAFVPPVRRLFGTRAAAARTRRSAPEQWAHPVIELAEAQAARGFKDGSTITVAVVDSGIDASHPDLKAALVEYKNFLTEKDKDFIGHGTHVAGIIGARAATATGVAGVSRARLLAIKALPRDDNFDATAYYRALRYVIGRAQVLNLSLGGDKDPAEIDILRDVIDAGVVVVAAMGNEFEEGNPTEYPAAMPEVCAVGATRRDDRRAWFSNTGKHIDLVAPGVEILSTTPTYKYDDPEGKRKYDAMDGTSMATPCVAGAAALILARHPGFTPAQVIKQLTSSADRVANAKKGSPSYGGGRLNVRKALAK